MGNGSADASNLLLLSGMAVYLGSLGTFLVGGQVHVQPSVSQVLGEGSCDTMNIFMSYILPRCSLTRSILLVFAEAEYPVDSAVSHSSQSCQDPNSGQVDCPYDVYISNKYIIGRHWIPLESVEQPPQNEAAALTVASRPSPQHFFGDK